MRRAVGAGYRGVGLEEYQDGERGAAGGFQVVGAHGNHFARAGERRLKLYADKGDTLGLTQAPLELGLEPIVVGDDGGHSLLAAAALQAHDVRHVDYLVVADQTGLVIVIEY